MFRPCGLADSAADAQSDACLDRVGIEHAAVLDKQASEQHGQWRFDPRCL